MIHIGLVHHIKELTRIGGQAFDVAPLSFSIDRVKREAGFAGTGQPRDHHKFVAWNINVDILEVMFARTAHFDIFQLSHVSSLCLRRCIEPAQKCEVQNGNKTRSLQVKSLI